MAFTLPAYVAPNELIESAWGNSVVDALDEQWMRHVCRLSDTGQTLSAATQSTVAWGTEIEDTDGYHSASSASIIIPSVALAGTYSIKVWHSRAAGNWSSGYGNIRVNSTDYPFAAPATAEFTYGMEVDLVSGDTIIINPHNAGSATTFNSVFDLYRWPME